MSRSAGSTGWAGWVDAADGKRLDVTSDRLGGDHVANRLFPKVRSWFALGAPIELLSPLSVARIVALAGAGTWPIVSAVGGLQVVLASLLTATSLAMVAVMMRSRALAPEWCPRLLAVHLGMTVLALGWSDGDHRSLPVALLALVMAIFAGLFLTARALWIAACLGTVAPVAVLASTADGRSLGDGAVLAVFGTILAAMTALTAKTSRRSGLVDADTGLPNVRGMADVLDRTPGVATVVAAVHLRGVGEVRDALGHGAGRELVRRAVEDLGQVLPTRARIGRGTDEDLVVLVPCDGAEPAEVEATVDVTVRQIQSAIGTGRYLVGDVEVSLNAHVGIALALPDHLDGPGAIAGELLRRSALAARVARDAGDAVARWDGRSTTLTADDLEILADLRTAGDRGELWVAYQPQVRTPDGRIVAVEALLRWTHPVHGFIPPGRFIPLAERTGFVDRLTEWVLAETLDAQVRWRAAGLDVTVSVNVSPLSLRAVDFAARVAAELDRRALPSDVLMLEVTESMAFDIPEAVERLAPLRARGVKISIDDFGTGYTSLSVLPRLPLDELKVDQQFVRDADTSKASEAIVRSVCELAHRLGLTAVAEGVETERLANLMTTYGFDLLQGYHFARPMPEDELVERLRQQDVFDDEPAALRVENDPVAPNVV